MALEIGPQGLVIDPCNPLTRPGADPHQFYVKCQKITIYRFIQFQEPPGGHGEREGRGDRTGRDGTTEGPQAVAGVNPRRAIIRETPLAVQVPPFRVANFLAVSSRAMALRESPASTSSTMIVLRFAAH